MKHKDPVIVVHLRLPRKGDPGEMRSDPFYELGSFGCTGCHRKNLLNPKRSDELVGARLAFAQGGPLGFRLIHLTPPVRVNRMEDRTEVRWSPRRRVFRYEEAPILIDRDGRTDFPKIRNLISAKNRETWPACFSSAFRSRRTPLPGPAGNEVVRVFSRLRSKASPAQLASSYADTMPHAPNVIDADRRGTLERLRARWGGQLESNGGCVSTKQGCTKRESGCGSCSPSQKKAARKNRQTGC